MRTTRFMARKLAPYFAWGIGGLAIAGYAVGDHEAECPTPETLVRARVIDPPSKVTDAWNTPFKILCDGDDEVHVISFGPDKREGTADDLRVPEGDWP